MAAHIGYTGAGCAINYIDGLGVYRGPGNDDKGDAPTPKASFLSMFTQIGYDSSTRMNKERYLPPQCAHLVFCQSQGGHYGEKFRDFILENSLGTVAESLPGMNKQYSHTKDKYPVTAWIWTPDHDAVKALWAKLKEETDGSGQKKV